MSADSSGKISLALGAAKKPSKPAAVNGVKRSHDALHEHDEQEGETGRAVTVSHFDHSAGGAIDESKPVRDERPLEIPLQANRDWKDSSQRNKRQRSTLPTRDSALQNGHAASTEGHGDKKQVYGLNILKKEDRGDAVVSNGAVESSGAQQTSTTPLESNGDAPIPVKTEDERAVDALLGKQEKSDLILPAMTEEEAFARDFKDAPEMASLADYDRIPVEQFGAALLRGMGWKEGEGIGSNRGKKVEKTVLPKSRPSLLGIGAKEEAAVAQELGTWGKAAKDRRGPVQIYNPVLLRDKQTGELFTEEELEKKKQQDEREKYEMEFEREEERKDKDRRRREKDDSRERSGDRRRKDDRRNRSDDRDRRRYDSDEEYYRRKDKERRRKERERDGSRDRERLKRHDGDMDRHRDRHRDHRR